MPWTAPQVVRPEPLLVGDERAMLEAWLDYHRQTLLGKCGGPSVEPLRRRARADRRREGLLSPADVLGISRLGHFGSVDSHQSVGIIEQG